MTRRSSVVARVRPAPPRPPGISVVRRRSGSSRTRTCSPRISTSPVPTRRPISVSLCGPRASTRVDGDPTTCTIAQETLWNGGGVWETNFLNGFSRRPEDAFKIDGSYFFNTGNTSHELKFGGRRRESDGFSDFKWPGRNIFHIAGENFGVPTRARRTSSSSSARRSSSSSARSTRRCGCRTPSRRVTGRSTSASGTTTRKATSVLVTPVRRPLEAVMPRIQFANEIDPGFDWS